MFWSMNPSLFPSALCYSLYYYHVTLICRCICNIAIAMNVLACMNLLSASPCSLVISKRFFAFFF
jgi:hypothetical protein